MRYLSRVAFLCLLGFGLASCRQSIDTPTVPDAYRLVVEKLSEAISYELEDKQLPAFGIVLVDDQEIIWADGFGYEDPDTKKPADAATVYRVGSVSKLFTDIGIMQLVEKGEIDLDAPVSAYIPTFNPANQFDKPITLRQLTSHRSGLIREPAVGNYFEDSEPTLAATVASLNGTSLIYEPETKIKYSNAGIGVVGYVLETTQGAPFVDYLKKHVLDQIGLENSAFYPTPQTEAHLAKAYMWTLDGREFEAPLFQLGMSPAGSMYAPVTDLGIFLKVLFNGGEGPNGPVLKPETIEAMWTPQYSDGGNTGFGIGFNLSERAGHRMVGHGGAIYGFATQLYALPDKKLGVVTTSTMDGANTITARIAAYALDLMLAAQENDGGKLPDYDAKTEALSAEDRGRLRGSYKSEDGRWLNLSDEDGVLRMELGSISSRVKGIGKDIVLDDRHIRSGRIEVKNADELVYNQVSYVRTDETKVPALKSYWAGLVGEYGWDHNTQYIFEEGGQLYILTEWFFKYPLEELDENTYAFPDYGLYHGEKIVFTRDDAGQATNFAFDQSVVFERR